MSGRPARRLWLVRHGSRRDFEEPDWARRAARPFDPPLSARGRREAAALAERFARAPVVHVVSSPFLRCVETASPIAERLRLPLVLEAGLSEWLNRAWFPEPPELLPPAELAERFPCVDPGVLSRGAARFGESGEEALRRSGRVARTLARELAGGLVLLGHGASVLGALLGLVRMPRARAPEPGYGTWMELEERDAGWALVRGPLPALSPAEAGP